MAKQNTPFKQRAMNLTFAAIAAQAGCLTLIIVFSALLGGLWLDAQLGQRGPCTFGLLVLSIPVSLYAMLRLALGAISRIQIPENSHETHSETTETKEV